MQSLVQAARFDTYPAQVDLVLSDKPDAPGLAWAQEAGLQTAVLDYSQSKAQGEAALQKLLIDHDIDLVCLAGFMRLLSEGFTKVWAGKILNIHPSLLPAFPGNKAHHLALAAGVKVSGCTVHFVDAGMDTGAIIDQRAVTLSRTETLEGISTKVLAMEHQLYPECLARVAADQVELIDGCAVWR